MRYEIFRCTDEAILQSMKILILMMLLLNLTWELTTPKFSFQWSDQQYLLFDFFYPFFYFISLSGAVLAPLIIRFRKGLLLVFDEAIVHATTRFTQELPYKEIIHVNVHRNKWGKISLVKLESPYKTIRVSGYENMDTLFKTIEKNISDKSRITFTNADLTHTGLFIFISSIFVIVAMLMEGLMWRRHIYDPTLIFALIMGLVVIVIRPLGLRFSRFEAKMLAVWILLLLAEAIRLTLFLVA